jgi:hypothetical protein
LFFILFDFCQANTDLYDRLCDADQPSQYRSIITSLLARAESGQTKVTEKYNISHDRLTRPIEYVLTQPENDGWMDGWVEEIGVMVELVLVVVMVLWHHLIGLLVE